MNNLVLINPYIHQEAKLKKEKFLERIKNVEMIRTCYFYRNLLINEKFEWDFISELHSAINKGLFSFTSNGYKFFAFEISKEYYEWFSNNDIETIQKQIIAWIAAVYHYREDLRDFFEEFIFPPVLEEVKEVVKSYFSQGNLTKKTYKEVFLKYINCLPPKFLVNPITDPNVIIVDRFGLKGSPHIRIKMAYFTKMDWLLIIERDKQKLKEHFKTEIDRGIKSDYDIDQLLEKAKVDNLDRGEANKIIWNNWLYSYNNFDKSKSHIYKLVENNQSFGYIYILRQRNSSYFKIGWTEYKAGLTEQQSIEERVASLQTGNPVPLDIVGSFQASGRKTENTIHHYFISKRQTGEWFLLSETDWQNILNDDWRINNNIF